MTDTHTHVYGLHNKPGQKVPAGKLRGAALRNVQRAEEKKKLHAAQDSFIQETDTQNIQDTPVQAVSQSAVQHMSGMQAEKKHFRTDQASLQNSAQSLTAHSVKEQEQNQVEEIPLEIDLGIIPAKKYQPQHYPWVAIEQWFVEGAPDEKGAISYPTIFDVVERFGASYQTVRGRMLEGDWIRKRDQWKLTVQKAVQKQSMTDLIAAAAHFDDTCIEAAQRALNDIMEHFFTARAAGHPLPQIDLDRLGRAAQSWQKVGRLALGLSTENNATKLETRNGDLLGGVDFTIMTDEELTQLRSIAEAAAQRPKGGQHVVQHHLEPVETHPETLQSTSLSLVPDERDS